MDTRTIWAERVAITNATRRPLGNADVAHTLQDAVTAARCSAGAIGHRRSGLRGVRLGPQSVTSGVAGTVIMRG